MLLGIETVVYYIKSSDLGAAASWYKKTLGCEPNHETEYYVGFTVAGYELGLHPVDDSAWSKTDGQTAYWSVTDIDQAIAHFVAHGAMASHPVTDVGGDIKIGSVKDPFGNELGLIQNPHSPNRR